MRKKRQYILYVCRNVEHEIKESYPSVLTLNTSVSTSVTIKLSIPYQCYGSLKHSQISE